MININLTDKQADYLLSVLSWLNNSTAQTIAKEINNQEVSVS